MPKRKPKGKDPPDLSRKKSTYRTIKTSLKSILRNYDYQPMFNDIVIRCNQIVTEAYQFIRLYCLYKFHREKPIPELNEKFISYCIKTTGFRNKGGGVFENTELKKELEDFYENEFRSLLTHSEKHDLRNLSFLIGYLTTQIHTGINNNIKIHFVTRLLRFINITATSYEEGLTKQEALVERKKLKEALFTNDHTLVPERYQDWLKEYRKYILPEEWAVSLPYDVKVDPTKYLQYSFNMNIFLEGFGRKLFQPLSLRNSIIPHYITFDTAALINLFFDRGRSTLFGHVTENQIYVWDTLFKLDHPIFNQKGYSFKYMMSTDGIAVSLLFIREDAEKTTKGKKSRQEKSEEEPLIYIDDLTGHQLDNLKSKNIVGADPGKFNLLYLADGNGKKLRYTAFQRRTETLTRRNARIVQHEKLISDVTARESTLSDRNSKTVNYENFKEYLRSKNLLNAELREFYERELFRKLKWRHFVYTQKSEDKFLNRIGETFGQKSPDGKISDDSICIAYGDWSRSSQMKGSVPTKGIGLRKLISKRFLTVNVNEFRTSKLCHHPNCHRELEYLRVIRGSDSKRVDTDQVLPKKKVYRCLICKECVNLESKQPAFVTRDLNSALNIRQLALCRINRENKPPEFERTRSASTTTNVVEKVG